MTYDEIHVMLRCGSIIDVEHVWIDDCMKHWLCWCSNMESNSTGDEKWFGGDDKHNWWIHPCDLKFACYWRDSDKYDDGLSCGSKSASSYVMHIHELMGELASWSTIWKRSGNDNVHDQWFKEWTNPTWLMQLVLPI